jgi:LDH2 family malate/lactate/ureidoglycolate dehydrogenase
MPVFTPQYLHKVAYHIYRTKGTPDHEAEIVATHQVKANLVGHDSHGVIHIPEYCERIDKGHIVPGAPFVVEKETPNTAVINGNWGFGFVVTEKAMRMAIDKARTQGVAAITIHYQSHIGRLGDYPTMAAREGMIGLITADSGAGPKAVAPFGGRARRLGTNPICIGLPSDLEGQVLLDMATSAVAAGKISLARNRNEPVPLGWIVDKEGNPTTNPNDYSAGGAILPVGADQGHKGYGLSFMVEVFSGLLTGLGFGIDPQARHNDGVFIAVFEVDHFRPLEQFKKEVKEFAEFIKTSPPAAGFTEVLYPGEIEYRTELKRREEGIFVEDETWRQITKLMKELKVEEVVGQPA